MCLFAFPEILLHLISAPFYSITTEQNIIAKEGDNVTLSMAFSNDVKSSSCQFHSPTNTSWNRHVRAKNEGKNIHIFLENVVEPNRGMYSCVATNKLRAQTTQQINLSIPLSGIDMLLFKIERISISNFSLRSCDKKLFTETLT